MSTISDLQPAVSVPAVFVGINQVMQSVSHVKKGGRNTHHKYNFSSEADIITSVRKAITAAGLVFLPAGKVVLKTETVGKMHFVEIRSKFVFVSCTDGSSVVVEALASAADSQDKYMSKAETQAFKYALVQSFMLPRVMSDPDYDAPGSDTFQIFKDWCSQYGGFAEVRNSALRSGYGDCNDWDDAKKFRFMKGVEAGQLALDIEVQ